MTDKSVNNLTGVKLCEEAALGMGWKLDNTESGRAYNRYIMPEGRERYIAKGCRTGYLSKSYFRPDLDGNHLAEVIAEMNRRGIDWRFNSNYGGRGDNGESIVDKEFFRGKPRYTRGEAFGDFPSSLLRAFVAFCRAQLAKTQEGS